MANFLTYFKDQPDYASGFEASNFVEALTLAKEYLEVNLYKCDDEFVILNQDSGQREYFNRHSTLV